MYKLEFTLKQHTPLIHFQHDQAGATLRATEVKPKLDRFLIESLTKRTGKDAFEVFKANAEWRKWLVGNGEHPALDYKLKISIDDEESLKPRLTFFEDEKEKDFQKKWKMKGNFPMLLANMGGKRSKKDLKDFIHYDFLKCNIISLNETLRDSIKKNLCQFFASNNFGNRNDKGFGSFTVVNIDEKEIEWEEDFLPANSYYLQFDATDVKRTFETIDFFYKWLKSGINYTSYKDRDGAYCCDNKRYKKSLLFEFIDYKAQISSDKYSWEKRWLKENFFTLAPVSNNPKFARALLGLSDKNIFTKPKCNAKGSDIPIDQNNKTIFNAHAKDDIDRIQSPIVFKPIFIKRIVKVYILINNTHITDIYHKEISKDFMFSENEKFQVTYLIDGIRYNLKYKLGEDLQTFDEHIKRLDQYETDIQLQEVKKEIHRYLHGVKTLSLPDFIVDYNLLLAFVQKAYGQFYPKNYLWSNIINSPVLIKQTR